MTDDEPLSIDCDTCVATGSTACNGCVVGHVLANDDGPIELVVAARRQASDPPSTPHDAARILQLLTAAGMVDDPPVVLAWDDVVTGGPAGGSHPSRGRPVPRR